MTEFMFNVDHGFLEGMVRGFKSGIIDRTDYLNMVQCETLEGEHSTKTDCCDTDYYTMYNYIYLFRPEVAISCF